MAVVGFFTDRESDIAKAYERAADSINGIDFGIAAPDSSGDLAVTGDSAIVLTKRELDNNESIDYSGEADAEAIGRFVAQQSIPLLIEMSNENAQEILFHNDVVKTHAILFTSGNSPMVTEMKSM